MPVFLESATPRWIGSSTDLKPQPAADGTAPFLPGSSFLEADTGFVFRWNGNAWQRAIPALGGVDYDDPTERALDDLTAEIKWGLGDPIVRLTDSLQRELRLTDQGALPVVAAQLPVYVTQTPVLDTSAYGTGDAMGLVPLVFADVARPGVNVTTLDSLRITDITSTPQNIAGELWLFRTRTFAIPALNAAWTLATADRADLLAVVPFLVGTYFTSTATGVSFQKGLGVTMRLPNTTSVYGLLVTRGAPTYAANSLDVTCGFIPA